MLFRLQEEKRDRKEKEKRRDLGCCCWLLGEACFAVAGLCVWLGERREREREGGGWL